MAPPSITTPGSRSSPLANSFLLRSSDLHTPRCSIHLSAIEQNLIALKNKCGPDSRLMVIVKAFAYGMDSLHMAQFLNNCGIDILGVVCMDEAIALRRAGVTSSIFVIHVPPYEIKKALGWDVEIGLSDPETLEAIESLAPEKPIKVHLHVDTGMKRFGATPETALPLAQSLQNSPYVEFEGIMTHLACADDPAHDAFTFHQIALFDAVIKELETCDIAPRWRHAANSAGLLRFDWPQFNMARIGLAAYGFHNTDATKTLPLQPAVTLQAHITALHSCRAGESVGYGRRYIARNDREMIAVLAIGYHDGIHRSYSEKGQVMIKGIKVPVAGTICMDSMMINVTDVPGVAVGDEALLFGVDALGHYHPPEALALSGETIVHELISCLGPRIQRIFNP